MNQHRILIVDDEINVLHALQRLLRQHAVVTEVTVDVPAALRLLETTPYTLIISDQRMPGTSGTQFLKQARQLQPDALRLLLTGYAAIHAAIAAIAAIHDGSVFRFLTKPWNSDTLLEDLRQAMEQYDLLAHNRRLQEQTRRQNAALRQLAKTLELKVIERTAKISLLNLDLQQSYLSTVQLLAQLTEMHNECIGSHAKRVARLCTGMAKCLGYQGDFLFQLEVAAILHDIGKIGLPAELLLKPEAALQRHELLLLQSHTERGELLVAQGANLGNAAQWIKHHHERCDGSGYPAGLRGRDIPLGARLIAVADQYDKMLNRRQSFAEQNPQQILSQLLAQVPSRFDAEAAGALQTFLTTHGKFLAEETELEIRLDDLTTGMTLSRDLVTARGVLLAPKDTTISAALLRRLTHHHGAHAVIGGIFIYRRLDSGYTQRGGTVNNAVA